MSVFIEKEQLIKLAQEYNAVKIKYDEAIRTNVRSASVMKEKTIFWMMIEDLNVFVGRAIRKRNDPFHYAIRMWMLDIYDGETNYTLDDLPAFICTYHRLKEFIAKKLEGFAIENRTDVIDALPLTGKSTTLRVLSGEASDEEQLREIIHLDIIFDKEHHPIEEWLEEIYGDVLCMHLLKEDRQ